MSKRNADAAGTAPATRLKRKSLAFLPDMRALAPLVGATALLLAGAFFAWQAWLIVAEDAAATTLNAARADRAQALAGTAAELRERLRTILASDAVTVPLAMGDEAGRQAAAAAVRQAMPGAGAIEVYRAGLPEVLDSDLRKFGYSKASQLLSAQGEKGAALLTLPVGKNTRVLSLAVAASASDKTLLGVVWVETPLQPLLDVFRAARIGAGRLELRQGDGATGPLLDALGPSGNTPDYPDPGMTVDGTLFSTVMVMPTYPIVLPHNLWLAAVLALVSFIFGALMLWLRKVGVQAGLDRLRRPNSTAKREITLAEAINTLPGASVPRTATTAQKRAAAAKSARAIGSAAVDRSIFRAYDIRGVVGATLTRDVAYLIGRAIGSEVVERGLREIVVGRDGRLSGAEMAGALIEGLRASGVDVIDVGLVPTPVVYFATFHLSTGSGVAVTGSHNPPDYNGFKVVVGGQTLAEDAIQALYARISEDRFSEGAGGLQTLDVTRDYIERVTGDIQIDRKLRVVVDCGNGIPGAVAPPVLEGIGCEVMPLYCDVDGTFPNHHPDPSDLHNLRDLILTVKQVDADLGLAFDGDGDRLGVVTRGGEVIFPDRLLMLFATDVLSRNPGASIIYDVKCTGHLQSMILKHGGSPIMWKTGHSLIKAKMKETDAELAGEMSGHFFFRERWYGFDDAIYAAARLMEILAADPAGRKPQEIFDELPKGVSTPELKIPMAEGEHYRFIERFKERASFEGARVTTIDGVRADWPDGWGLVRASNTTPVLVLRFDADNDQALLRIQATYRRQLLALEPSLTLPF